MDMPGRGKIQEKLKQIHHETLVYKKQEAHVSHCSPEKQV